MKAPVDTHPTPDEDPGAEADRSTCLHTTPDPSPHCNHAPQHQPASHHVRTKTRGPTGPKPEPSVHSNATRDDDPESGCSRTEPPQAQRGSQGSSKMSRLAESLIPGSDSVDCPAARVRVAMDLLARVSDIHALQRERIAFGEHSPYAEGARHRIHALHCVSSYCQTRRIMLVFFTFPHYL